MARPATDDRNLPRMRLLPLLGLLLPTAAFADCPEPGSTAPFTMFDGAVPTTVYRGADGNTVLRAQRAGGDIDTYEIYRGLFMLAGPDGQGGQYVFEYGAALDPVFRFTPGDRFEIPVTSTHNGEVFVYSDIYEVIGSETVVVGDCPLETVVIDYMQQFDDMPVRTTTLYYARDLGVVVQNTFDHDFTPETPRITSTTDRITADPDTFVPR